VSDAPPPSAPHPQPRHQLAAPRQLVSIDGLDGSGKSELARALVSACEAAGAGPVVLFRVDDFRRPLGALAGEDEATAYYERYYDFASLDACLAAFEAGAARATAPRWDPTRELVDGERDLAFGAARLGVIEGVFVLRSEVAARAPLILLEVSEAEARRRIGARDAARGRAAEVIEHRIDNRYFPAQRRYREAFDPVSRADVLIDNENWAAPRVIRHVSDTLPSVVETALSRVFPP
jgi:uridine kinase